MVAAGNIKNEAAITIVPGVTSALCRKCMRCRENPRESRKDLTNLYWEIVKGEEWLGCAHYYWKDHLVMDDGPRLRQEHIAAYLEEFVPSRFWRWEEKTYVSERIHLEEKRRVRELVKQVFRMMVVKVQALAYLQQTAQPPWRLSVLREAKERMKIDEQRSKDGRHRLYDAYWELDFVEGVEDFRARIKGEVISYLIEMTKADTGEALTFNEYIDKWVGELKADERPERGIEKYSVVHRKKIREGVSE